MVPRTARPAAVQVGLARTATIQRQIDLSGQHRGPNGVNAWVSAGADSLSFTNAANFPNASGTPFGGTVGVDYRTQGGIILGMAVAAGSQNQGFSTGGHFTQTGEAVSLYAAMASVRSGVMPSRATGCCRTTSRTR